MAVINSLLATFDSTGAQSRVTNFQHLSFKILEVK